MATRKPVSSCEGYVTMLVTVVSVAAVQGAEIGALRKPIAVLKGAKGMSRKPTRACTAVRTVTF